MSGLRSNREWIFWGRHDPLFAVATRAGKQKDGASPWTAEELLEAGRAYFAGVYRQWRQYGVGSRHCVEIGCGSGRITRQLAVHFRRVTALDVSPDQLASARELLGPDADRVTLALVSDPAIPLPDGSCDGVFSCEVFQHFDEDRGMAAYLEESHRVLAPGGTVCFQVPVRGMRRGSLLASPLRNLSLRVLRRLGRRRMMIYREFRPDRIIRMLDQAGLVDLELRMFRAAHQEWFHCYFLGRKP